MLDGQTISFIDTPGFDDTNLSDTNILNMIAAYLSCSYVCSFHVTFDFSGYWTRHEHGKNLSGVIYLHRILDNRVGGISARSFRIFRKLCGEDSLRSVVIATTMWDQAEMSIGEGREQELASQDAFFKPALEKGARLARHNNTLESAQAIIRSIIQQSPSSVTLQIQEELGRGLCISETQAGKELGQELNEQMERHREEMRCLIGEIQEATRIRDEESRQELTRERVRMEAIMARLQMDSENIVRGYQDALSRVEERLRRADATAFKRHADENRAVGGDEHQGQQTHSPAVQAVAATENSNAVLEGKLAAAIPVVGFWGKLAVMLAPFSLTWR